MTDDNRPLLERLTKFREPTFTLDEFEQASFPQRMALTAASCASIGWGLPTMIHFLYFFKSLFFVWVWALCCGESLFSISTWVNNRTYYIKALCWAMSFEMTGLGCASGPLTGKNRWPMFAIQHFCWPGTFRYSFFADRSPKILTRLFGGTKRTYLDVVMFITLQLLLWRVLLSSQSSLDFSLLAPPIFLLGFIGFRDKLMWLSARSEHYWVMCAAFLVVGDEGIAAAKVTALGIWVFAASSKLFPHFAYVNAFMTSTHPFMPTFMKRAMYKDYLTDLRPSIFAVMLARVALVFEGGVPLYLAFGPSGMLHTVCLWGIILFHCHIYFSFASAVPQEWQFLMIYGAYYLFGSHSTVPLSAVFANHLLATFSIGWSWVIPLIGAFFPHLVSFLVAFRYYAGNWNLTFIVTPSYEVWMKFADIPSFADVDVARGLRATGASEAVQANLKMLGPTFAVAHLPFRALQSILPLYLTEKQINESYMGLGEGLPMIASGWHFGDGHLAGPACQKYCAEKANLNAGDAMLVSIESAPLFSTIHHYTVTDLVTGELGSGTFDARDCLQAQPWSNPPQVNDKKL